MEYVIRTLPEHVDREIRRRAAAQRRDVESVIVEAIERGLVEPGPSPRPTLEERHPGLSELIGTWEEDPAFDEAVKDFERIDEEDWRATLDRLAGNWEEDPAFDAAIREMREVDGEVRPATPKE